MNLNPDVLYQDARERQQRFEQDARNYRLARLASLVAKVRNEPSVRPAEAPRRMLPVANRA